MSKLIGGEIIGTGTYGCVFKPQMECSGDLIKPSPDTVSKIMVKLDARKELREFTDVTRADPDLTMHLGRPTLCDVKDTYENKKAINTCNDVGHTRTIFYEDKLSDYALLVMKDGGQDITNFAHAVSGWAITEENKNKIELFWLEVSRLFYGLKVFKDAGLIHRDLNQNNIVYNMSIQAVDEFIAIIDTTINTGNVTTLMQAINYYEDKIPINYINTSKSILYELLLEKLETTTICE